MMQYSTGYMIFILWSRDYQLGPIRAVFIHRSGSNQLRSSVFLNIGYFIGLFRIPDLMDFCPQATAEVNDNLKVNEHEKSCAK